MLRSQIPLVVRIEEAESVLLEHIHGDIHPEKCHKEHNDHLTLDRLQIFLLRPGHEEPEDFQSLTYTYGPRQRSRHHHSPSLAMRATATMCSIARPGPQRSRAPSQPPSIRSAISPRSRPPFKAPWRTPIRPAGRPACAGCREHGRQL
jgi:hypothetical protein